MMKLICTRTFSKVFTHFPANDNILLTSVVLTNGRWFSSAVQVSLCRNEG